VDELEGVDVLYSSQEDDMASYYKNDDAHELLIALKTCTLIFEQVVEDVVQSFAMGRGI
jgi:hypothetical protein